MKRIFTYLLIFLAFVLTGCEGAKAPLGAAGEVALDNRLIGTWIGGNEDGEEASLLSISPLGETEYALVYKEANENESEEMHLRAFASSVNGVLFANITCIDCDEEENEAKDEEEWYFFTYSLESDDEVLVARALVNEVYKEGLIDLTDSAQIREYVAAHMSDQSFFEEEAGRFKRLNK
ncbi:MAG: hypothetical protein O3B41_04860 [Bacteroidetes bacterium]|nr:hypothetical protein [Bacteroidota bacterium]